MLRITKATRPQRRDRIEQRKLLIRSEVEVKLKLIHRFDLERAREVEQAGEVYRNGLGQVACTADGLVLLRYRTLVDLVTGTRHADRDRERLVKAQRALARKQKGSSNRATAGPVASS